jgi:hypothetical protein
VKFKYYLRGCGLGIILTVLVLGISFALRGGIMTDEKVIARAGELGMVMPGDDEDPGEPVTSTEEQESTQVQESTQIQGNTEGTEALTETEVTYDDSDTDDGTDTAADEQALSVVSRVRASAPSSESASTSESVSPSESASASESVSSSGSVSSFESETKKESDSGKSVTIRVQKGDVCREVAEKLESKGLVSDAEGFRKYMQKKGYDNRICIGSFTIKQGMTYEEIAKILVGNT